MTRRVGRFTKQETSELLRMFEEGYSIYKICKSLKRSQKSIRNNLIRLDKIDGETTPRRYQKTPESNIIETYSFYERLQYIILISIISFCMIVNPLLNPLDIMINYFFIIIERYFG